MNIRQITKKGDPMLRLKLPKNIIALLHTLAKQNKRRYQDEMIKRLAASFSQGNKTESLQLKFIPELQKIYNT